MTRLTMADLASDDNATPGDDTRWRIMREQRLMRKEERLEETNARLERQRKDEARREKARISQRDRALHQQREANQRMAAQIQAHEDMLMGLNVALDTAVEVSGYDLSPTERKFIIAFATELHKAKTN